MIIIPVCYAFSGEKLKQVMYSLLSVICVCGIFYAIAVGDNHYQTQKLESEKQVVMDIIEENDFGNDTLDYGFMVAIADYNRHLASTQSSYRYWWNCPFLYKSLLSIEPIKI
jgi:hypothetical protein